MTEPSVTEPPRTGVAAEVIRRFQERGLTIATAESTTGGLTGHRLVAVPGASRVFIGGVAAYGRRSKEVLLRVPPETVVAHGSVSEETVMAMARGAREVLGVDVAVSESGIASPSDNPERPGGLYWLGLDSEDYARAERHVFTGDRLATMQAAAERLLEMLLEYADHLDDAR